MGDVTSVVKILTDKLGGFLHIFDASYIISGFLGCMTICGIFYFDANLDDNARKTLLEWVYRNLTFATGLGILAICYCLGVVLFVIGRKIRIEYFNEMRQLNDDCVVDYSILKAIVNSGLTEDFKEISQQEWNGKLCSKDDFRKKYEGEELKELRDSRALYQYYTYAYTQLRLNETKRDYVSHCDRKWVEMSMFDGFIAYFLLLSIYLGYQFVTNLNCNWTCKTFVPLIFLITLIALLNLFVKENVKRYGHLISDVLAGYKNLIQNIK